MNKNNQTESNIIDYTSIWKKIVTTNLLIKFLRERNKLWMLQRN